MEVRQGDIFWAAPSGPQEAAPGIPHPYVVVQDDLFNRSRISSVVVCALTTNRKRASLPGNVLLEPGEGNLPVQSVVEVSKLTAVEKDRLGDYIGSLGRERIEQILAGIAFIQRLAGPDEADGKRNGQAA